MQEHPSGHFPGISADPLFVGSARQSAMARFFARGFEAAAVTAFGAAGGAMPRLSWTTTVVEAVYDRPFGFLALHRHSRLVLAAGWVTDPEPYPDQDPEYAEEYPWGGARAAPAPATPRTAPTAPPGRLVPRP
jgi:hypothetical protein